MESNSVIRVITISDVCAAGDRFVYQAYDYRPVLPQINHKNYHFREKKTSQVMKEWENLHQKTEKGGVNS